MVADVLRPSVGAEDGGVQGSVGVGEPRRPLVVEVGEGAPVDLFFGKPEAM